MKERPSERVMRELGEEEKPLRRYDKLFFDFNNGIINGYYEVVLPKEITIGDSEIECDGNIVEVIDHNDACYILRVSRTSDFRDAADG